MTQIQRKSSSQSRKLFKYYIEKNTSQNSSQSLYFYRLNRFRFNSYNQAKLFKSFYFKYPIIFGLTLAAINQYAYHMYDPVPVHH